MSPDTESSRQKTKWAPLERMGFYKVIPINRIPVSLSMRILLVFLLIMAVSFAVTLRLSLKLIYDNIWRETEDKLNTDLKIARMMYESAVKDVATVVDFTANRFFLIEAIEAGDLDRLKEPLEKIRRDRGLDIFVLVSKDGVVLLRTTPPYSTGDSVMNDELVRLALMGQRALGTTIMTKERLAREGEALAMRAHLVPKPTERVLPSPVQVVDSGMLLMAAYPIVNARGEKLGALYGAELLNNDFQLVDSIRNRMFPLSLDDDANLAMVSIFFWDTRVSTSIRQPNGNRAVGFRMFGEASESVLGNNRNWVGTSWVVNDWYFAAYDPIRDSDGKVIGALGIGLWKGPFIAVRNGFIRRYVKISLAGFAIILLFGWVFSRMLTKPIRQLAEASGEIARGNFGYHVHVKSARDEVKELEQAFNAMSTELQTSMEEKDRLATELQGLNQRYVELLGFASHELKQPIGTLKSSLHLLRKEASTLAPEKREAVFDRLDRNVEFLASMSGKYLHYSKIESGELSLYPRETRILADVIQPVIDGEQKKIAEKEMCVEIQDRESLERLRLLVDPEMLQAAFSNLISNAVKYGYQRGLIQIGFRETDDSYVFHVRNSGEAIPLGRLAEVFGKFKRFVDVQNGQKGTGLGLFNTKTIIELHGGSIRAESDPGRWMNFIFELPKTRVSLSPATPKQA